MYRYFKVLDDKSDVLINEVEVESNSTSCLVGLIAAVKSCIVLVPKRYLCPDLVK